MILIASPPFGRLVYAHHLRRQVFRHSGVPAALLPRSQLLLDICLPSAVCCISLLGSVRDSCSLPSHLAFRICLVSAFLVLLRTPLGNTPFPSYHIPLLGAPFIVEVPDGVTGCLASLVTCAGHRSSALYFFQTLFCLYFFASDIHTFIPMYASKPYSCLSRSPRFTNTSYSLALMLP